MRSGSALTKKPATASRSVLLRPRTGVPMTSSGARVCWWSSVAHAPSSVMNKVALSRRPAARSASVTAGGSRSHSVEPAPLMVGGRVKSVGRSSDSGAPASRSFQNASWRSSSGPVIQPRCQAAKSA